MIQPPMIQVRRLSKQVDVGEERLSILQDIQFEIKSGETVAIVGASGSGKSSLLGMLAGLDIPSEGELIVDGKHHLHAMDEEARAAFRAKNIGFIFQSFLLIPELTALENVMLPAELHGLSDAKTKAELLLDAVGLKKRSSVKPSRLSGGEQQRIAIARAFMTQPRLLLADEPTGNLDQQTGKKIADLLFQMQVEQQSTLVIVTHDPELASRCQRQLIMHDGHLEENAA